MINQVAGAEKITGGDGFGIKDLTFPPFTKHIIKSLIKLHIQIGLYKKEEDWEAEEIISPPKFKED